jgi:hypothetical protein
MGQNNFTDINGFNAPQRRERPGLRTAVAAGFLGALVCAVWAGTPYVAGAILVIAP